MGNLILFSLLLIPSFATAAVTLKEVDGGPEYFKKWSRSLPSDPQFFPIAVWAETLQAPYTADKYKALGINTFTNIWEGPTVDQMIQLRAQGMYAIGGYESNEENLVAHMYGDELDIMAAPCASLASWLKPFCQIGNIPFGGQYTLPKSIQAMNDVIRQRDPTRPIYMQYAKTLAVSGWAFWYLNDQDKKTYALAADILSYDYYVIADPQSPGSVWNIYDGTKLNRQYANYSRPVWPFIELSRIFANARRGVTPEQVSAEVWNALIGGARGIQYFNHNFFCKVIPGEAAAQGCTEHLLTSPEYAVMSHAVQAINQRIARLAPVLNAPFAENYVRTNHGGNMSVMTKFFDGQYYVFAIPHAGGSRNVTFTVEGRGNGLIHVVDENRQISLKNGQFSDQFANENMVHIYQMPQ